MSAATKSGTQKGGNCKPVYGPSHQMNPYSLSQRYSDVKEQCHVPKIAHRIRQHSLCFINTIGTFFEKVGKVCDIGFIRLFGRK